jgi:hypothetical protein
VREFPLQSFELLNNVVKQLLLEHTGGEKFFDALDNEIRNNSSIMSCLTRKIKDTEYIICSGKFGRMWANISAWPVIVVNGNLRKGEPVDDISYLGLQGKSFTFVDDSFYSGKTRNAIQKYLESQGASLVRTVVVYDGSLVKDPTVESLYRYYD